MTDTKKMAKKKYTCPLCKFESEVKDFLVNPNFRYVICKECGNMFMDKEEIERIAAQIKVESSCLYLNQVLTDMLQNDLNQSFCRANQS